MQEFSLNETLLRDILQRAKPLGHHEEPKSLNLGFGFLYYGTVRALRPRNVVVIGSGYGFSVICLALGIKDNGRGRVLFVDPSYSLSRMGRSKPLAVTGNGTIPSWFVEHFARFGVEEWVEHFRLRSDEFFRRLRGGGGFPPIDLAFIDGNHAYKDVKHDFLRVAEHSRKNTYIFLHDTNLAMREFLHHSGVKRWLKVLKRREECFEILNFPYASGVAIVRLIQDKAWKTTES